MFAKRNSLFVEGPNLAKLEDLGPGVSTTCVGPGSKWVHRCQSSRWFVAGVKADNMRPAESWIGIRVLPSSNNRMSFAQLCANSRRPGQRQYPEYSPGLPLADTNSRSVIGYKVLYVG